MSKKTGHSSKEMKELLSRGFFNRRYIVRNILSATMLVTFLVFAVGISALVKGDAAEAQDDKSVTAADEDLDELLANEVFSRTTEDQKPIEVAVTNENKDNNKVTDADKEAGAEVSAIDTTPVSNSKYANRFIAIENGINIRKGAGADYDAIAYLDIGMVGEFIDTYDDWSHIVVGDLDGYVKSEFILTGDKAAEYAEQNHYDIDTLSYYEAYEDDDTDSYDEAGNDTDENDYEDTEDSDSGETTEDTYEEPSEDTEPEDNYQEQDTEDEPNDGGNEIEPEDRDELPLTDDEVTLIAAVVALEAGGECYEGQLAVANVIINRLHSGIWGNTIADVVYATNQFEVVGTDAFSAYVAAGPSGTSLQAAQEALAGTNNIGSYMSFRPTYFLNSMNLDNYTIIGNHIFF